MLSIRPPPVIVRVEIFREQLQQESHNKGGGRGRILPPQMTNLVSLVACHLEYCPNPGMCGVFAVSVPDVCVSVPTSGDAEAWYVV